ncbi:hypothetical protein LP420_17850 [Massilia sp. B-10]|nr:hypothetical protein LP420_17850 [Massilia sp. B-10]
MTTAADADAIGAISASAAQVCFSILNVIQASKRWDGEVGSAGAQGIARHCNTNIINVK